MPSALRPLEASALQAAGAQPPAAHRRARRHPPRGHRSRSLARNPDLRRRPNRCFLIPPAAMEAACRADKGTIVSFTHAAETQPGTPAHHQSGGIEATSVYPTLDPKRTPVASRSPSAPSPKCRLPPWKGLAHVPVAPPPTPPATSSTACCSRPRTADVWSPPTANASPAVRPPCRRSRSSCLSRLPHPRPPGFHRRHGHHHLDGPQG
jgi:hypothetical protein